MPRRLKFLNALHAFEAAARLGTFTRVAQELGVTPAAVGQQVRILEGYLGCKLFKRTNQGLQATANASLALADLHSGFDRLEAGFGRLVGQAGDNRLSVSVAPALAWRWLTPRIQRLYQRCPNIDLRMDASLRLVDVAGGEFDIAVRYGEEEPGGLVSPVLFEEHQLPVCAPGLWQDGGCSTREDRLLNLPLIHVESETSDTSVSTWRDWAAPRLYAEDDRFDRGPRYPSSAMALQAALDGQGVTINGLVLVIDDLVEGRLVAPLGPGSAVKQRFAYRLVYAPLRHPTAIRTTFLQWVNAEAVKTKSLMADFLSAG